MGADAALRRGVPDFWRIKSFVPHCFHGRDREGRPVVYQQPAGMRLDHLKSHGLGLADFVHHYVFLEEHLAQNLFTGDDDNCVKADSHGQPPPPRALAASCLCPARMR